MDKVFYDMPMISTVEVQERNKAIVIEMIERIFVKRDPSVLDEHPGLSETVAVMERRAAAFPDLSIRVENIIAEGDHVAYIVWAKGTHLGPFAGVPATGKSIEYSAIGFDRLEDGRIVQHNANPDLHAILVGIGAMPRS